MTWTAFGLIFFSVFLHAFWNFASKKSDPSMAFYLLMASTSTLMWMPVLFFAHIEWSALEWKFWLVYGGSIASEMLYVMGLALAYRSTDISLAYPLGRALPVLTIAAITAFFGIGKVPTVCAVTGMTVIFAGSVLMPLHDFRNFRVGTYLNKSFGYIAMIIAGTTGYTILDSMGGAMVRTLPGISKTSASIFYLFLIESGLALSLGVYVLCVPAEHAEFRRFFLKTPLPHFAGIASSVAYALVLVAMNHVTNVSYVQAFRQMSLPIGVVLGIVLLKESCGIPKILGISLIVAGLVLASF